MFYDSHAVDICNMVWLIGYVVVVVVGILICASVKGEMDADNAKLPPGAKPQDTTGVVLMPLFIVALGFLWPILLGGLLLLGLVMLLGWAFKKRAEKQALAGA